MHPSFFEHLHPFIQKPVEVSVVVNDKHIASGKRGDASNCPLCLAIKEHLLSGDALVTSKHVMFYDRTFDRSDIDMILGKGRIAMVLLPPAIAELIKEYEEGEHFVPFKIELNFPAQLLTSG